MDFQLDQVGGAYPYRYIPCNGNEIDPTAPQPGARFFGYISQPNNVLSYDQNRPAGGAYYHTPRGSWKLKRIWAVTNTSAERLPIDDDEEVYAKFDICEPLLLSPFIFGSGHGKQGFYGIQSMNFQMVMSGGNANRAWRSTRISAGTKTATVVEF